MGAVIELNQVRKQYGSTKAVDGITLTVSRGEIFGIVGPNGAGKTTLIEIIEGLRKANSGRVVVLGKEVGSDPDFIKQRIGIMLQSTSIPEKAKIKEVFRLFASFYDRTADLREVIGLFGLEDKMNQYFRSLSGGWKQRVSLALALINDPDIIFLDEPSMGLDPNARRGMWDMILRLKQERRTVVLTTHYMEEAETLCDRVAVISGGKLVALDTPRRLVDRLGNRKQICFKKTDSLNHESLASLPHVADVDTVGDPEWVKLRSDNADQTLRHLFRLADGENWTVSGLTLEAMSMNDVFNQLTGTERSEIL